MCKVSAQQLVPTAVSQSSPVVFMLSRQRGQSWIILFGNGPGVITKGRRKKKKKTGGEHHEKEAGAKSRGVSDKFEDSHWGSAN